MHVGTYFVLTLFLYYFIQQYLTAFGSTVTVPLVLYKQLCMDDDKVGLSELISTIFFVSGIATLIQTLFGTR